jgi:CheY-like chemotaxis protein
MPRIMVIDRDPFLRSMVVHMLQQAGHDVIEVTDGPTGIELMQQRAADVIITDIHAPGRDGWKTIVSLRAELPGLKVIAISGGPKMETNSNVSLSDRLGAQRIFCRPIQREKLLSAVSQLLTAQ